MQLLGDYLVSETEELARNGIRLSVIGRRDRLPEALAGAIARAERATAHGTALLLRVAIDYSARDSILNAAARAASAGVLTRTVFGDLVTGEPALPDVDLVIRTGGEKRLSDFLLWESAYAELHFTDCMWPDFDAQQLAEALACFRGRNRRFGALPGQRMSAEPAAGEHAGSSAGQHRGSPPGSGIACPKTPLTA
jgi:undecaprenyl diphosphate synthase